jgi:CheY-like chemotaxis protein
MLRTGELDAPTAQRAVETIDRNAGVQAQLIEDILDVSRIIAGKLQLDVQSVDLKTVIESALDSVRPAATAKEIRLQTVLDPSAMAVSGDPARLQQVVWNLLSNAIKFTPRGGRVLVRLARVNSHVEIAIDDTGQGIESAFLPHVFERFRQADSSSTRSHGGLGLGLAIVKHLVELHGGRVEVESAGPGLGSTFRVNLPLRPVASTRGAKPGDAHEHAVEGIEPAVPARLSGVKILVVDDEPDTRDILATVLERLGARVIAASSAAEALVALDNDHPDVLISDIEMPGCDGYELIRRIRRLPAERGGHIPAAALTAYARAEDRLKALVAGFNIHMAKPVRPEELAAVAANLSGRRYGVETG